MTREEKLERAGEYVLGLLDGADREAFEALLATDAEAAAMVRRFADRMQALDATASATEAGTTALWQRIEDRLATDPREGAPPARVVPFERRSRRRFAPLEWVSIAASVVIAAGLGYLAGVTLPADPRPTVIAVLLTPDDASPGAIIEAFADDSVHIVPLEDFVVPEGQVLQVWTLPDVETGPVSLGTLSRAQDVRLAGPELPMPQDGQLYEITLEPAPGSPTGRPTGPILVKGFAKPPA